MSNISLNMLIIIAICIVGFLMARELLLWYWKVNNIVSNLENIERHLELIASKLSTNHVEQSNPQKERVDDV